MSNLHVAALDHGSMPNGLSGQAMDRDLEAEKEASLGRAFRIDCEVCCETSVFVRPNAEVQEDEMQRMFLKFDRNHKGHITLKDVEAAIMISRYPVGMSAKEFYDSVEKYYPHKITFWEFTKHFSKVSRDNGKLGWGEKVHLIMSESSASIVARFVTIIVMVVILASTVSFIMETDPSFLEQSCFDCEPQAPQGFIIFETICIMIFTVEYSLRVFTAPFVTYNEDLCVEVDIGAHGGQRIYPSESKQRLFINYILLPMNLVDFFAIMPFYLELALGQGGGFGFLRVLRLARVFRIFKMGKYSSGAKLLGRTLYKSLPALQLLVFFSMIGLTVFASCIYFVEVGSWEVTEDFERGVYMVDDVTGHFRQPSAFTSIPRCFWFVLVTATTVGYGDMTPTSSMGKVIGSVTMIAGLLVLALPITVFGSNFSHEYQRLQEEVERERVQVEMNAVHKYALMQASMIDGKFPPDMETAMGIKKKTLAKRLSHIMTSRREASLTSSAKSSSNPLITTKGTGSTAADNNDGDDDEEEADNLSYSGRTPRQSNEGQTAASGTWYGETSGSAAAKRSDQGSSSNLSNELAAQTTLHWVAVMHSYDQVTMLVKDYRDKAILKPITAEVLMEEANLMVKIASNPQSHFADMMPHLNSSISWLTRGYMDQKSVLDRGRAQELIKAYLNMSQTMCTALAFVHELGLKGELEATKMYAIPEQEDPPSGGTSLILDDILENEIEHENANAS